MFLSDHKKTAIATNEKSISYRELIQAAQSFSAMLPPHTQRVALYSENRPEWIFALYGSWLSAAAVVPIDFLSTPEDVAYILNDCQAEWVFCSCANRRSLEEALEQLTYQPRVHYFDESAQFAPSYEPKNLAMPDDRVACIVYTSGTTGGPKGVVLTFENIRKSMETVGHASGYYLPSRRVLALLPFHHILPLLGTVIGPIYTGATIALCPSLSPTDMLATLQNQAVDMMVAVPRFYTMMHREIMAKINASKLASALFRLADRQQSKTLSRILFKKVHNHFGGQLDVMISGGAPLGRKIVRDFHTLGFNLMEGYGMTESSAIITFPRLGNMRFGSVGQATLTNEVRICDGEIIAKGKNIFTHYLNKPAETAESLRESWLYTGDLGYLDDDGHLFITGRKKELIILPNGKNISPDEIETKLSATAPLLAEVAVFMHENRLHALLYPIHPLRRLPKQELEEKIKRELIIPFNTHVVSYKKVLTYTIIQHELPKTRLGKTKRFELPALLKKENQPEDQQPRPQTPEYREIQTFIEQQCAKTARPDDHLEYDLGLDSLDRVSLLAYLQQTFGVQMDESALEQHATVRKLADFIRAMKTRFDANALDWSTIITADTTHIRLPRSGGIHLPLSAILRVLLTARFNISGEGTETLPAGPCIFAPNHQSFFDGLFVTMFLKKRQIKRTFYYAKAKHVSTPIIRAIAERCNVVIVDSKNDVKHSIQSLAEVLKQGNNIIIFPEGTRTPNGALGEFKKTFAILSKELNVPIVPVAIDGAFAALHRDRNAPRGRGPVQVRFLPAIQPNTSDLDLLTESTKAAIKNQLAYPARNRT